jgi:ribonucleoside-diphosphate reductase alpha chain
LVFSFPTKAPKNSVTRNEISAIQQLEQYLNYKDNWCEHNPSITVYVKEHEWMEVGAWVYKHFDDIIGVTFLPHSDHVYKQAPYQEITKEEYDEMIKTFPKSIDWTKLQENTDLTEGAQELACVAGVCTF